MDKTHQTLTTKETLLYCCRICGFSLLVTPLLLTILSGVTDIYLGFPFMGLIPTYINLVFEHSTYLSLPFLFIFVAAYLINLKNNNASKLATHIWLASMAIMGVHLSFYVIKALLSEPIQPGLGGSGCLETEPIYYSPLPTILWYIPYVIIISWAIYRWRPDISAPAYTE